MNRTHRRLVAWLGILGIAFAQLAVTAHACMIRVQVPANVAAAPATPHHGHCSGQGSSAPVAPQGDACESAVLGGSAHGRSAGPAGRRALGVDDRRRAGCVAGGDACVRPVVTRREQRGASAVPAVLPSADLIFAFA